MIAGAFYIPHVDKRPLGEDAYFIGGGGRFIGIADGVGGWGEKKIDAGVFARELMSQSKSLAGKWPCGTTDPVKILDRALCKTSSKGTATACIIALTGKWLNAAVLGDSGFAVIREDKIIHHSPSQQHSFNFPYQVGRANPEDCPLKALRIMIAVEPGDVVVAGSDGLFDNMFDEELLEVLIGSRREGRDCPHDLAKDIAEAAFRYSTDRNRPTPFEKACRETPDSKMKNWRGGKPDDITVVVARVVCTCG